METFSALLALCDGNPPATGEFLSQRPVTRSYDVFFDLRLNKWLRLSIDAGDIRRHCANYDITVMISFPGTWHYRLLDRSEPFGRATRSLAVSKSWWRHQMETFSALLAICAGNSPVPGEFPTQRPVTRSFHVSSDLRLNKPLSKQSWGWWFETPSWSLWRQCNELSRRIWLTNQRPVRRVTKLSKPVH